jgi:hypothetical protein
MTRNIKHGLLALAGGATAISAGAEVMVVAGFDTRRGKIVNVTLTNG